MSSELAHRSESFGMLAVLHEPTRRLGAKEDANHQDKRRNESRAELQTPRDITSVLDNHVGTETQEDTGHNPKLPEHDQGTTNSVWSHLSRVDRDCSILCTDANTHDETRGK
jgi:hypothetical protein